jgi:hypothetical protein
MTCQENCANTASAQIAAAWNRHTQGEITLDELWKLLEDIQTEYEQCIENCNNPNP